MSAPFEGSHPPAQHAPQPQFHYEPPLGSTENRKPNSPEPVQFPPPSYHNSVNQGNVNRSIPPWSQTDQGYPPPQMVTRQPSPDFPQMNSRSYESSSEPMACNCLCLRPNDVCGCLTVCFGILCCCCGLGAM